MSVLNCTNKGSSPRDLYKMTLDAAEMPFGLAEVLFLLYLGNAWFGVAKYVP